MLAILLAAQPLAPAPIELESGGGPTYEHAPFESPAEEDYVEEAATLDAGLVAALQNDLAMSPEQFLANGEASSRASEVLKSLESISSIGREDGYLDGTTLKIHADSDENRKLARAAGAIPTSQDYKASILPAPADPEIEAIEPKTANLTGLSTTQAISTGVAALTVVAPYEIKRALPLVPGQPIGVEENGQFKFVCSIGLLGYNSTTGAPQALTSGNCVTEHPGPYYAADVVGADGTPDPATKVLLGDKISSPSLTQPDGIGVIELPRGVEMNPKHGSAALDFVLGTAICANAHSLASGAYGCGLVNEFTTSMAGEGYVGFDGFNTDICVLPIHDGLPLYTGNRLAVGMALASTWSVNCDAADQSAEQLYTNAVSYRRPGGAFSRMPNAFVMAQNLPEAVLYAAPTCTLNSIKIRRVGADRERYTINVKVDGNLLFSKDFPSERNPETYSLGTLPHGQHTYEMWYTYKWNTGLRTTGTWVTSC